MSVATRRIFAAMLREEWRLHSRLFSGQRFAAFPLLVALLVGAATQLLVVTGTALDTVLAGSFALAFAFGLHTGSIGLVSRDAVRDLLGDTTLLVFSARTLPISQRRLVAVFVVKDAVYYALLFLLPISVGLLPVVRTLRGISTLGGGVVALASLWLTLWVTFLIGIGVTLAALGLANKGVPRVVLVGALALASVGAWLSPVAVVPLSPYGLFLDPSVAGLGVVVAVTAAVYLVAAATFDVTTRQSSRTAEATFRRWNARVRDPVATKTLLDVHRSAGGFGKVLFSAGILAGVTAALIDLAGQITGVTPSVGVSFGAVLGLTGFTTYNWLAQVDDVDAYLRHPLAVTDVFRAKFRAFLLLGPAVAVLFYVAALAWLGGRLLEGAVGAVLLVGVACYIFGVTVYLTGLSPNEFLFDTALFGVFGVAMMVPLVPILVVAFALSPIPAALLAGLGVGGVGLGLVGVGLYRRALPKWERHHRG